MYRRPTTSSTWSSKRAAGPRWGVGDDDILDAEAALGRTEGIYAEPAGAAPVAGVRKALAEDIVESDETVCVVVTGNGLKDTESAMAATGGVTRIDAELADVQELDD